MQEYKEVAHTFEPICNENSKYLILGTFPSVKSRETDFYYGHPQNRFWKVIAHLTNENIPLTIQEKKSILLKHEIAIWDVIAKCKIAGSSDSSIKDVVPSDIQGLLKKTKIERIFANGAKASELYNRYIYPDVKIPIIKLPSTSPANAAYRLERLCEEWKKEIF